MPVELVPESDLRAALRSKRVDPKSFEANVRRRLKAAVVNQQRDPLSHLSPLSKAVSAMLPVPLLTGMKAAGGVKAGLLPLTEKLVGVIAFPAICLFLLVGTSIFGFGRIHQLQQENVPAANLQDSQQQALEQWWNQHWWQSAIVFAVTLVLGVLGVSSILFAFYLISCGLLVYLIASFAKHGIGHRQIVARGCGMGLMFLSQISVTTVVVNSGIHLLDQSIVTVVLFSSTAIILGCYGGPESHLKPITKISIWFLLALLVESVLSCVIWRLTPRFTFLPWISFASALFLIAILITKMRSRNQPIMFVTHPKVVAALILLGIPFFTWWTHGLIAPTPAAQIQHYVESFDGGPFSSASWREWEIPARWTVDSNLPIDLSKQRQLISEELKTSANPYILGTGARLQLIYSEELMTSRKYEAARSQLLGPSTNMYTVQNDWVIYSTIQLGQLTDSDRDLLEKRLLAELDRFETSEHRDISDVAHIVEVLKAIDRPINHEIYQQGIHKWLLQHYRPGIVIAGLPGGFSKYLRHNYFAGDLDATSAAITLMTEFGVAEGVNLDYVRSFLRSKPVWPMPHVWVTAVLRDRVEHIPGTKYPAWYKVLYYERTLLAAILLSGMCLYAVFISPIGAETIPAVDDVSDTE